MSKRRRAALRDCAEQMTDLMGELRKSLEELQHLQPKTFKWQMSNAQTWVSVTLTDSDTCLNGVVGDGGDGDDDNGNVKQNVKRRITDVARVTDNALYMINRLGHGGVGKRTHRSGGSSSKN